MESWSDAGIAFLERDRSRDFGAGGFGAVLGGSGRGGEALSHGFFGGAARVSGILDIWGAVVRLVVEKWDGGDRWMVYGPFSEHFSFGGIEEGENHVRLAIIPIFDIGGSSLLF